MTDIEHWYQSRRVISIIAPDFVGQRLLELARRRNLERFGDTG